MLMKKAIESKEEIARAGSLVSVVSESEQVGLGATKLQVLPLLLVTDSASLTHFLSEMKVNAKQDMGRTNCACHDRIDFSSALSRPFIFIERIRCIF